ncbi:MAG: succinate--CoA ligase subunit alpha [Acidobacteriota bacterium]
MSILVDAGSRLVVQGITGSEGSFHTRQCREYGTQVVAGVVPGKGGMLFDDEVPIFHTMKEAVEVTGADVSLVFVPPPFAADAVKEAADAGLRLAITITEGIPTLDMVDVVAYCNDRGTRIIGPNCPGVISPGKCKVGIMPGFVHKQGSVGVISRSGTLTYEAVDQLTRLGLGQSTCIGIGGDPVIGTTFSDCLEMFAEDEETTAVVLIGEIGGTGEEEAAAYIGEDYPLPVVAFIAGSTAPPGKRMGHAGAIIAGGKGTAAEKMKALADAGVNVVESPSLIGHTMSEMVGQG